MSENYNRLAIHYSACNEVYFKIQECEKEFPFKRVLGKCSEHFVNLRKCMQRQRRIQQADNHKIAKEKQERLKRIFSEEGYPDIS